MPLGALRFARRPICRARKTAHTFCPPSAAIDISSASRSAVNAAREAAGLDDVRIHDLRHSFASVAVSGGARLYLVGKVFGHR
jgi:site-specific recombinase XerD